MYSKQIICITIVGLLAIQCQKSKEKPSESTGTSTEAAKFDPAMEPLAGQPAFDAKPSTEDLDYQVKYHRAFEAVLWALPAVDIYRFRAAAIEDLGYKDNDIIAYSKVATPKLEAITANSSTPYITAFSDLSVGPTVLEIPAAGADGSLYGQVVDHWQLTIADIGPSGLDKGKASKYLFTPPNYKGTIPSGYLHVASPSYRIAFAFRSVRAPGKSVEDAYAYAKRLKMYRLSEASNPPTQKFIDPSNQRYATLPFFNDKYFNDVQAIFSLENANPKDKVIMGMLASLGIEHGKKEYAPDEKTKKAMNQGAVDAYFYMLKLWDNYPKSWLYWPDRHYASLMQADKNKAFTYEYDNSIDIETRALQYFQCTYVPKILSANPATQYIMCMNDFKGNLLEAGKTYKVDVPANMPVKQFWALTVYDKGTYSFIYSKSNRTTLSTYDLPNMKKNPDGSIPIYVGPEAPAGFENNWIPTRNKRPMPMFRLYGPTEEFNNKTFKMPDFELVE
ncbi:DUF1254 domain-containing protein [Flavobacterium ajazii]|uniref:DUF1254 domain-containing protein n=1 Tax=Flavobacterium ajazii TaxID=2692318 RepID=UPI0013D1297D|nr:DUF1214 domain-containing protein [Flavobacterium ajazii]